MTTLSERIAGALAIVTEMEDRDPLDKFARRLRDVLEDRRPTEPVPLIDVLAEHHWDPREHDGHTIDIGPVHVGAVDRESDVWECADNCPHPEHEAAR